MSTFTDLRDQLLRLRGDPLSNEGAERNLCRIGAQAARLYHHHAQAGVPGFDLELTKRLRLSGRVGDPTDDQRWGGGGS